MRVHQFSPMASWHRAREALTHTLLCAVFVIVNVDHTLILSLDYNLCTPWLLFSFLGIWIYIKPAVKYYIWSNYSHHVIFLVFVLKRLS